MARNALFVACLGMATVACSAGSKAGDFSSGPDASSDALIDVSVTSDAGLIDVSNSDTLSDALLDINNDAPSNDCPGEAQSFIWIANTGEGTLSKVCTVNGIEVARYYTSPQEATGDPSRTSVNMHGDMVVTNRDPVGGASSVTKFAGDIKDCIDRNSDGYIGTSFGPTDVKPWGEDECMLWNTPLTNGSASIGARATAWDGEEASKTGLGGSVYIGAMANRTVYKLNGDTGKILSSGITAIGHYGGAVDGKGNLWTLAMTCTIAQCSIERISLANFGSHEAFPVKCGYGISIDGKGRVWTSGLGCVSRFDPATKENKFVTLNAQGFNRGIAVGSGLSAGYIWSANTQGDLLQVDPETLVVVKRASVGGPDMVGVAIDYEGYVWTVSQGADSASKVHPKTWAVTKVSIGSKPYTYSDMTGLQLRGVTPNPK